jgi:tetratricopeptide (TPR) repeat protein
VEENAETTLEIAQELESAGYHTWYYERDNIPGLSYLLLTAQAIEASQAIIVIISPQALNKPSQITRELVRGHETIKYFIPILLNLTHAEFQQHQPEWRQIIGSATSIRIPPQGVKIIAPRILLGLKALGIHPADAPLVHAKSKGAQILSANRSNQDNLVTRQTKLRPIIERSPKPPKSAVRDKTLQTLRNIDHRLFNKYRFYLFILLLTVTITGGLLIFNIGRFPSTLEIITKDISPSKYNSVADISVNKKVQNKIIAEKSEKIQELTSDDYFAKGLATKNPDQEIIFYTKAIELNQRFSEAYNNRGYAYFRKAMFDQAIADYNIAIEINSIDGLAYNNRAIAYYYKKEYGKAWKDIQQAQKLGHKVNQKIYQELLNRVDVN